jgi:hypothetical protein
MVRRRVSIIYNAGDGKKKSFSTEEEDNLVLEDMYEGANFDFNLSGVHSGKFETITTLFTL